MVNQRRINEEVDFNGCWTEYKGFDNLPSDDEDTKGEFWIGLQTLHWLTSEGQWELRVDYMYNNKLRGFLTYRQFRVGPASGDYQLNISGFSGNASDPIAGSHSLNGMKFSTRDRDNNLSTPPGYSCALQA